MTIRSEVAARLADTEGVVEVPDSRIEMFFARDFLDPRRCEEICRLIDAQRRPSTITDDIGEANFRTSETCDLDSSEPVIRDLDARLSRLTGIPPEHGEPVQGQRYAEGQEFRPHTDTFNPGGAAYFEHCAEMGQRTWTAMLFLNRPEAGGATRFKTLGKTIRPEPGKLLAWNNLTFEGQPNAATLHQGMKVRKGTKYIITKWYRERPAGSA